MIGFFCTASLLHFSKRFIIANIHFSIEITLLILHFFHLPVSTFSAAALFRRQHVRQQLYFNPVLISTPVKVKSGS